MWGTWLNYFLESYIICGMRDLIAERDKKLHMESSIIKWWNVHYMTPQELAQMQANSAPMDAAQSSDYQMNNEASLAPEQETSELENQMSDEQMRAAQEIIDRLNREAQEDELKKQQEISSAREAAEKKFEEEQKVTKGTIDHILAEKDETLRDIIEHAGQNE